MSSTYEKMQGLRLIKFSPEHIYLSEGLFCQFFPEHRGPHFWYLPWTSFRDVKGQQLQWPWFNLCRGRWQVPVSRWQSPFMVISLSMIWGGGHFMTVLSNGAENVHFHSWQRFRWLVTQCAVTGQGHKTVFKMFWTTCLTSLLVQENIPSCCFFTYMVTLLPSSILYETIFYFIRDSVTHLAV